MYTRMLMLDLNLVVFIYVWIFFFTLFNWDTKDFTHFCVSSVHLKPVQFAFALQISFQVHEMGFNFHWAFALGAVNWLSVVGLVGWMPNDITATFERWPDATCTSLSRWRCGHTFCGGHFQSPPFMFATFALLLFLLLFTPAFVNTNRYVLVMARETPSNPDNSQSLWCSTTSRKGMDDKNKHLTACVLGIVIGGENIDWQLPSSVQTVCELLGVKKTTVYKYRKQIDIKYVQPKRQTRSDALDSQPWYYWIPFGNWTVTKAQTQTIRLKSMTLVVQIITDMIPCLTTQEKRIEYA